MPLNNSRDGDCNISGHTTSIIDNGSTDKVFTQYTQSHTLTADSIHNIPASSPCSTCSAQLGLTLEIVSQSNVTMYNLNKIINMYYTKYTDKKHDKCLFY